MVKAMDTDTFDDDLLSDTDSVESDEAYKEDDTEDTRTHKIFHALEEVCLKWDLGKPIWFDANIAEFQRHARTRFGKDNFVEETEFDYLEIQVIDED